MDPVKGSQQTLLGTGEKQDYPRWRPHPRKPPQWPSCVAADVTSGSLSPLLPGQSPWLASAHTVGRGRCQERRKRERKMTAVERAVPWNTYSRCLALGKAERGGGKGQWAQSSHTKAVGWAGPCWGSYSPRLDARSEQRRSQGAQAAPCKLRPVTTTLERSSRRQASENVSEIVPARDSKSGKPQHKVVWTAVTHPPGGDAAGAGLALGSHSQGDTD